MKLRVLLFEQNPSLQRLLKSFIEGRGHRVQVMSGEYSCSLHELDACSCPSEKPCADAVIINTRMATIENMQILVDQAKKGCKLPRQNKAIMNTVFTESLEQSVRDLGFSTIKQPLKMAEIAGWLNECGERAKLDV
ncbi:MAG: hypothetical protein C0616_05660 [Desulfuromonas sp.]|nr:MAG: hypothetical protein C0616_05660 [Desulfuromonas sp.]